MTRPWPLQVVQARHRRRGAIAGIAQSLAAILAVGGTGNDWPGVLGSSDARAFHPRAVPAHGLRDVCWLAGAWFVVGEDGLCARSRDDGASWTAIATGTEGCLWSVAADGDQVWIAGDEGYVARVALAAGSAERVDAGFDARIAGVVYAADTWWLLGGDGALARWSGALASPPVVVCEAPLTDLVETRRGTLIVSGGGGTLLRSTDDGETWAAIATGRGDGFEAVACLVDGTLLVAGGGGTLLVSTDDGASFAPVEAELDGTLWTITPFGRGALVGGDRGTILRYGPDDDTTWATHLDRFRVAHALDAVLAPGPAGFVGERLRAYVEAVSSARPVVQRRTAVAAPRADGDWQAPAARYAAALWRGSTRDYQAIWGVPPPPALVAFEAATRGAHARTTFEQLRLDVALMAEPPPDKNLFEMLVLNDQLDDLGTALAEAFAAVTAFGRLDNGDTYHYEVHDRTPSGPRPRTVVHWDHDERVFSSTIAGSLDDVVYLAALCKASDDDRVSDDVVAAGFARLDGRVAPSWQLVIDERAPGFAPYAPERDELPRFLHARALWIIGWLRHDGITRVDELGELFDPDLNPPLSPDQLARRLEVMRSYAATALYALWRGFLFDEPALDAVLAVARGHAARLVRDAAALIDELRAGRNELGALRDVRRQLDELRALELDPR